MKYWPIAALAIQALTAWICWSLRQLATTEVKKLVDAAVASLTTADQEAEAAVDDHETRITVLEKDVEAIRHDIAKLPTKADLAQVSGKVDTVASKVDGARAGIERIESYFLAKGVERG
ncbi:hypothetical protein CSW59_06140 [Caulobacter sp. BP25]|nr:hypothetical protein CSW59_06140 [Caulobacter sp. BP25]